MVTIRDYYGGTRYYSDSNEKDKSNIYLGLIWSISFMVTSHACIEASACEATPENMDTYITSLNQELFTTTVKPLV